MTQCGLWAGQLSQSGHCPPVELIPKHAHELHGRCARARGTAGSASSPQLLMLSPRDLDQSGTI